jgi:hypothetical protein
LEQLHCFTHFLAFFLAGFFSCLGRRFKCTGRWRSLCAGLAHLLTTSGFNARTLFCDVFVQRHLSTPYAILILALIFLHMPAARQADFVLQDGHGLKPDDFLPYFML